MGLVFPRIPGVDTGLGNVWVGFFLDIPAGPLSRKRNGTVVYFNANTAYYYIHYCILVIADVHLVYIYLIAETTKNTTRRASILFFYVWTLS